jgi:hypothetical protein
MKPARKIVDPEDYILSVLSPEDRLDAALKIAREAFKGTKLTMRDIDSAVKSVRRKAYEGKKQSSHRYRSSCLCFCLWRNPRKSNKEGFYRSRHLCFSAYSEGIPSSSSNPRRPGQTDPSSIKSINFWICYVRNQNNCCLSSKENIHL